MGVGTILASIFSIVLTVLAAVGWVVFIGGFGANNTGFLAVVDLLPPETREILFLPYNSHFIVAVLSPILFIVMIVMSVLTMVLKNKWGPYISAIMTVPIIILGAFVMISSGVVFFLYSSIITVFRLTSVTQTASFQSLVPLLGGLTPIVYTMFAGMFLEILFLTGALIAVFIGAILAAKDQAKSVD